MGASRLRTASSGVIQACDVDPSDRRRMAEIENKTKRYPTDLTDEEWARIEVRIPAELSTLIAGDGICYIGIERLELRACLESR
jgi:hypothetical protein